MNLNVIVGPACSDTLAQGVERKIREMSYNPGFKLTVWDNRIFSDGEIVPQITENVRGADTYVIQPTPPPAENFEYLKMLLAASAESSAGRVTAVLPYMGGLRQDRKDRPRVAITAKKNLIEIEMAIHCTQGHLMILQPHFPQVSLGVRGLAMDLLYPTDIFVRLTREVMKDGIVNVVPTAVDIGSAKVVEAHAKRLNLPFAVADKRRGSDGVPRIQRIYGDVKDKTPWSYDDMTDTAGSQIELAEWCYKLGSKPLYAATTHGILSGKCIENLLEAQKKGIFAHLYITDSVRHPEGALPPGLITVVSVGELIGEAIFRNHNNLSISEIDGMFNQKRS